MFLEHLFRKELDFKKDLCHARECECIKEGYNDPTPSCPKVGKLCVWENHLMKMSFGCLVWSISLCWPSRKMESDLVTASIPATLCSCKLDFPGTQPGSLLCVYDCFCTGTMSLNREPWAVREVVYLQNLNIYFGLLEKSLTDFFLEELMK